VAGKDMTVTFVPHLVPMNRGILATIYAKAKDQKSKIKINDLTQLYKDFYKDEPFIRIFEDKLPNTKYVAGTNYCHIAVQYNEATGKVIVLSAIDNLVKGAAGQAVQNMNLICGFPETTGLRQIAVYP
jgi:N-acetyl-gamma-glutamyl-phosphate reductase